MGNRMGVNRDEKLDGAEHGNCDGQPNGTQHGTQYGIQHPPRVLWVATRDLEYALFPLFLDATEWPPRSWKTVASHLRKLTDSRQKDCRQGPDRHGSSPVEYLIRGPGKRRQRLTPR